MIQHFYNGIEYTTRAKLAEKYGLNLTGGFLQNILIREEIQSNMIQERNQYYFLKDETELIVETEVKVKGKK